MVTQYDPTALSSLNVDEKKLSEILEGNIANGCIRTLIRIIQDTYYPGGVIIAGPRCPTGDCDTPNLSTIYFTVSISISALECIMCLVAITQRCYLTIIG